MPIATISFDVNSSLFIKELKSRQAEFAAKPYIGYTIIVPDDLKWWYWLEFGTAGRQDPDAPYKTSHGGTYPIDPVEAKALAWEESGHTRFAFHVDHPGIRPRMIYRGVRDEILAHADASIRDALEDSISVSSLRGALLEDIMPFAIHRMGQNLETQAPGTKEVNPFRK